MSVSAGTRYGMPQYSCWTQSSLTTTAFATSGTSDFTVWGLFWSISTIQYPVSWCSTLPAGSWNVLSACYNTHQNRLVSNYQLNAQFLYSITIYMLHYNPPHVLSSTMLIFRRSNCIITASGIVTLCKWPYSTPVESALNRRTVWPFTQSDDSRWCNNTICPPEDEHSTARNVWRIIM